MRALYSHWRKHGVWQQEDQFSDKPRMENVVFLMLTDLDSPKICPPSLIKSWVKGQLSRWFFLRVAVMEVESWILADRESVVSFLAIPINHIPSNTDEITNPKEFFASLARRSRKTRLRIALVPAQKDRSAKTGDEYTPLLSQFVRDHWDIERAATVSLSLKRTLERLSQVKENK